MKMVYMGIAIEVKKGDITEEVVGAIVNPANSKMVMLGGVAGAIRRKGGFEIEQEAMKHAPVPVGKAIATGAGKLRAKYVIHAPTMELPAMRITTENVYKATKAALEKAEELNLDSIAMPGMGTGVGGVPPMEAARAMVRALKDHISKGTKLKRIVFVDLNDQIKFSIERALLEIL